MRRREEIFLSGNICGVDGNFPREGMKTVKHNTFFSYFNQATYFICVNLNWFSNIVERTIELLNEQWKYF